MSQNYIRKSEVSSRPIRQMTHNKSIWLSSGLVQYNKVSEIICLSDLDQILEYISTSVYPNCIRYNQLQLLLELNKPLA